MQILNQNRLNHFMSQAEQQQFIKSMAKAQTKLKIQIDGLIAHKCDDGFFVVPNASSGITYLLRIDGERFLLSQIDVGLIMTRAALSDAYKHTGRIVFNDLHDAVLAHTEKRTNLLHAV